MKKCVVGVLFVVLSVICLTGCGAIQKSSDVPNVVQDEGDVGYKSDVQSMSESEQMTESDSDAIDSVTVIANTVSCSKEEADAILALLQKNGCKDVVHMQLLVDNNVFWVTNSNDEKYTVMLDLENGYEVIRIDDPDNELVYKRDH